MALGTCTAAVWRLWGATSIVTPGPVTTWTGLGSELRNLVTLNKRHRKLGGDRGAPGQETAAELFSAVAQQRASGV